MRGLNGKKGFTIVELAVVLGIFTILIAGIYTVLLTSDSTMRTGLTYIELSQDVRLGIDRMIKELHNARRSTISISDGSYIEFQIPGNSDTIKYSLGGLNGRQLIRTEPAASTDANDSTVVCNNVQSIQFIPNLSGSIISINLQTQKTSLSRRDLTATLNVRLKARN